MQLYIKSPQNKAFEGYACVCEECARTLAHVCMWAARICLAPPLRVCLPIGTLLSAPEVLLFTFSKMAAGMYLEHYLDSKICVLISCFGAKRSIHLLHVFF